MQIKIRPFKITMKQESDRRREENLNFHSTWHPTSQDYMYLYFYWTFAITNIIVIKLFYVSF